VPVDVLVRPDTPDDYPAIRRVNEEAFGGSEEANLIDALRAEQAVLLSTVAVVRLESDPTIVGHIMFSRMWLDGERQSLPAVALAPLAVRPGWQRQGIGGQLIRDALVRLRRDGEQIVVVVGHADYYPRFGFCHPVPGAIEHPFPVEVFMTMELTPHALADVRGRVRYPAALGL
jgi:putative acetyltransferase